MRRGITWYVIIAGMVAVYCSDRMFGFLRTLSSAGNYRQVRDGRLPLDLPRRLPNAGKLGNSGSLGNHRGRNRVALHLMRFILS